VLIRDFDADGGFAGDRGQNADRLGAHAEGDVFIEPSDLFDANAGGGHDLVAGDNGADVDLAEGHLDAEFAEDAEEVLGVGAVFFLAVARSGFDLFLEEESGGNS